MAPACTVLMVAEKPSLAQSIASILSGGQSSSRRGALDVHEWEAPFAPGGARHALYRMTSVIGHVYSLDFTAAYQSWDKTDPMTLFGAEVVKTEANPKAHVCRHLQQEARGADFLVLWLDCDREGENICFEVMDNTLRWMRAAPAGQRQVFRSRFSAITAPEIKAAMANLVDPNENEALAVDARQELDLKVGVAFTRFQTRYFQGRYGNLDASVVSYGPCQTPTLNFCVERHQAIAAFQPEPFWVVAPIVAKAGETLSLEWGRGRVFDRDAAAALQALVADARSLKVTKVSVKEERRQRPTGLNTVELLKVASSYLGIGPQHAMQLAERLYTSGYLSYPRTESSAYPPNFDISGGLQVLARHPLWGEYVRGLLAAGVSRPKGGVDVGDHPPITPVRAASEDELGGGDAWRVYDYVARHFLASLSPDALLRKSSASLAGGGEVFSAHGSEVINPGFFTVMHWKAPQREPLPPLSEGEVLPMSKVELVSGKTGPPDHLSEAELIGLMEQHGIGTDASISTHINNICERSYVQIQSGRRVVPTELGIALIRGYQLIDDELCKPQVRAHVEAQIALIAQGAARKEAVVAHTLAQFESKFAFFVSHIGRMDALFEATFSPLASSGKATSKCGKCQRYMKLIASRPSRLYCPGCEDVYSLPQGGAIKLYKGLECPLDGFELLLFSLGGADGKTTPLCPFCYNHPPFEGAIKIGAGGAGSQPGMPCTTCLHPVCKHAPAQQGVLPCPECGSGMLVLDPVSAPKWRLDCSRCSFLIYLPKDLHDAKVDKQRCEECSCRLLRLEFKKGSSPLEGGATSYLGCLACDELLEGMCEVKHSRAFVARGGRRGHRGRGRGRSKRGRGNDFDPRMSFRDF